MNQKKKKREKKEAQTKKTKKKQDEMVNVLRFELSPEFEPKKQRKYENSKFSK